MTESTSYRAMFIHSHRLDEIGYPSAVPLATRRAGLTRERLASMGLLSGPNRAEVAPEPASREALETFHTPRYLDLLRRAADGAEPGLDGLMIGLGTVDCPVFKDVYDYPALACGASLLGADLLLEGRTQIAFNPSGGYHHAGPEKAAGFCYLNDVAIACLHLAEHGRRVLYLDVDVHHGDGVQNAFYDRADVMTLSFHESGLTLFPGTGFEDELGSGAGRGYAVNVPFRVGTYDAAYLRAFRAIAPPLIGAFDPDVIVLELGMDALAGDPLANLKLTNNAHVAVLQSVLEFDTPMLVTGGGGYHVDNTVRGWALAWAVLCGEDSEGDELAGLGGVMLETTDWAGGLRDRQVVPDEADRRFVDVAVDKTIEAIRKTVFPIHGL